MYNGWNDWGMMGFGLGWIFMALSWGVGYCGNIIFS